MAAFAVLASLLSLHLGGPRPVLGPRDAPRVIATVGYGGPGYSGAMSFSIRARGGTIRPQRGTQCDRQPDGWTCLALPLHHGATEPLSFLVTGLRAGTPLVVTARVSSPRAFAQAVLRRPVRREIRSMLVFLLAGRAAARVRRGRLGLEARDRRAHPLLNPEQRAQGTLIGAS